MHKKAMSVLLVLLVLLMNVTFVYAEGTETANDLLEMYNQETLKGIQELRDRYEDLLVSYEDLEKEVNNNKLYNEVLLEAEQKQRKEIAMIDEQVTQLLKQNVQVSQEILDNFEGSFENLVYLDNLYQLNVEKANALLQKKNNYTLSGSKNVDYESLEGLEQEVLRLKDKYDASIDVSVLGDVTNVKYPLGESTYVTSPYGNRLDPMNPTSIRFHAGIDLKADVGTEVLSVFNGVVADTGYGPLGGYYVKVSHGNGIQSYYCHLSRIQCEIGQEVNQYDIIALSGNTGARTTGPHLHFGLYINGNSVDPQVIMGE